MSFTPKIVPIERGEKSLRQEIADYKRIHAEQVARQSRIMQLGKEEARARGFLFPPSFEKLLYGLKDLK